jgi:hypothetical protein
MSSEHFFEITPAKIRLLIENGKIGAGIWGEILFRERNKIRTFVFPKRI